MKPYPVLRVTAKLLVPPILLFALYVLFHGEISPGGGFQAGVIFAAAFTLYGLVFGIAAAERVAPPRVLRRLASGGVLLYMGVGLAGLARGGNYLEYGVLLSDVVAGQHLGIALVELGVGMTVASVMMIVFFAFARRERRP